MAESRVVYEVKKDLKTGEMVAIDHEKKEEREATKMNYEELAKSHEELKNKFNAVCKERDDLRRDLGSLINECSDYHYLKDFYNLYRRNEELLENLSELETVMEAVRAAEGYDFFDPYM